VKRFDILKSSLLLGLAATAGCPSPTPHERLSALDATAFHTATAACDSATESCLLPWPSDRLLMADPSTPTGRRIGLTDSQMPKSSGGTPVASADFRTWDGFSPMSSILVQLEAIVAGDQFVDWQHTDQSLLAESRTILLDAATGQRVRHFAELSEGAGLDPERSSLYIRPAQRLEEAHRYIVAIRDLRRADGTPLVAADPDGHVRSLAAHAEVDKDAFLTDVLAPLEAAGLDAGELVRAWSFTTASGASAWGDMLAMRDATETALGSTGVGCTITSSSDTSADPAVWRTIEGTITVPQFVGPFPGRLNRNPAGVPSATGMKEVPFTAFISRGAHDAFVANHQRLPLVTYGHGLYTSRGEVFNDAVTKLADAYPMIFVASDYTGLTDGDIGNVAGALVDLSSFPAVMEQLEQSTIAMMMLPRSVASFCADQPEFQIDGMSVVDGAQRYFYGNSQGAILGISMAALSTDMQQFALGVGGISYPVMLPRAVQWPMLEQILSAGYPRRLDRDLLLVMSEHYFDKVEGASFATHVLANPLPGSRINNVLFQVGWDDPNTPTVACELAARTMNLPQQSNAEHPITGLPTYGEQSPSGYVVFDFHVSPSPPIGPIPPAADNIVHEAIRRTPCAQKQLGEFLRAGGVVSDDCNLSVVAP
jgi:hypothetical protein